MGGVNKKQSFTNTLTGVLPQMSKQSLPVTSTAPKSNAVTSNPSAVSPSLKTPAAQAYVSSKLQAPTTVAAPQMAPVAPVPPVTAPTATVAAPVPQTPSTRDAYMNAYKAYQDAQKENARVTEAQKAYNDFMTNQAMSVAGREGRGLGIPLDIVRGEQERLLKQTNPQLDRLQRELGFAENAQEREVVAAKSGLDLQKDLLGFDMEEAKAMREASKPIVVDGVAYSQQADGSLKPLTTKEQEAFNLSEGQSRYAINPTTGQYELVASKGKTYAPGTGGGMTTDGGQKQLSSLAQSVQNGTISLDKLTPTARAQVAAELTAYGVSSGRQDELVANSKVVQDLLSSPNLDKMLGFFEGTLKLGNLDPYSQLNINKFNQLKGILSLDAREKLKGSGAISDFEFRVLGDAASALGRNLQPEDFKIVLQEIKDVFDGKYSKTKIGSQAQGQGGGSNIVTAPDGQVIQIID